MNIFRIVAIVLIALSVSSCTLIFKHSGGKKIASFEDRSIVYGWIDMTESGDRLSKAVMEQLQPVRKDKFYTMGIIPHEKNGYILYHVGMPKGTFKLSGFAGYDCMFAFVFCDAGTIYDLPKQGSTGGVVIKNPGTYYLGSYQYKHVKTRFWEGGKYDLIEAKNPPAREAMLKAIHEQLLLRHPEHSGRIETAMSSAGGK